MESPTHLVYDKARSKKLLGLSYPWSRMVVLGSPCSTETMGGVAALSKELPSRDYYSGLGGVARLWKYQIEVHLNG